MQTFNVLIDNGHGSNTAGKRSPKWPDGSQLFEWQYARQIAAMLAAMCEKHPQLNPVIITPEETDTKLEVRCERANKYDAKTSVFVSIHANAAPEGQESASGWEIWTTRGETKADQLATCIFGRMHELLPDMKLRQDKSDGDPDKESGFFVLKHTKAPAILSENGFMTNEAECHQMMTEAFKFKTAKAHYLGILDFFGLNDIDNTEGCNCGCRCCQ